MRPVAATLAALVLVAGACTSTEVSTATAGEVVETVASTTAATTAPTTTTLPPPTTVAPTTTTAPNYVLMSDGIDVPDVELLDPGAEPRRLLELA